MTVSIYRDECKCGHAPDSHHEKKYGCLTSRCDCAKYVNSFKPASGGVVLVTSTTNPEIPYHPEFCHNPDSYYDDGPRYDPDDHEPPSY